MKIKLKPMNFKILKFSNVKFLIFIYIIIVIFSRSLSASFALESGKFKCA